MGLLKSFLMDDKYLICSIVGTPTINGTIVSDITTSNYIRYATANILSGHSWEIGMKVYWNGTKNGAIYCRVADGNSYFRIGTNGDCTFNGYLTTNKQVWVHGTNFYKNVAGWYYIRLKYEIAEGKFSIFFGKTSTERKAGAKTTKGAGLELRYLTSSRYIYSNFNTEGMIDISGCYIMIENEKYKLRLPQ